MKVTGRCMCVSASVFAAAAQTAAGASWVASVITPGPITVNVGITSNIIIAGETYLSATVSLSGFQANTSIQGIRGTSVTPWLIPNADPQGFWNAPSVGPYWNGEQPFAASPALNGLGVANAQWDSGMLPDSPFGAQSPFGTPASDVGFGMYSDGTGVFAAPWEWLSSNPNGVPVGPNSTIGLYRITWRWPYTSSIQCSFVIDMNSPSLDQPVHWIIFPTPSSIAALIAAGLLGFRRRRPELPWRFPLESRPGLVQCRASRGGTPAPR